MKPILTRFSALTTTALLLLGGGQAGAQAIPSDWDLSLLSSVSTAEDQNRESQAVGPRSGRTVGFTDLTLLQLAAEIEAGTRRVPGQDPPVDPEEGIEVDPTAVPPPTPNLPAETVPIPDRWRLIENIGVNEKWWDPYNQNTLKADRPLWDDWFINVALIADTIFEPRSFPQPVGDAVTENARSNDMFGEIDQLLFAQSVIASISLIKGDTAFKPPDWEFRLTPIYSYNYVDVEETGIVFRDPRLGTNRSDDHIALQEAFVDYHIRNVSDRFDFDSVRAGIQPVQLDFRGFLFQDQPLGLRFFGTRENNLFQYNLGAFQRIEKDTNSGLNDLGGDLRRDHVFFANLYMQDVPKLGYVTQATVVYNRNREDHEFLFDKNGFLQRPSSFGDERLRTYDVVYLGLNGDGHFGRVNLTSSFYYAIGKDDTNQFAGDGSSANINAWFLALEPSIDFSWIRLRGSLLHASGDSDPFDDDEEGFDAIFENPQFAGADTSYWIRQAIPLIGGGGVNLNGRNGILPSLRSSKEQGQSNFNNPGLNLIGIGADVDLTPELRWTTNINYLEFDDTSSLEFLRNQANIDEEIGWDISTSFIYRPNFIQNIVFRASGAVLFAGDGFQDLYETDRAEDVFYSILFNLTLTY